MFSLIKILNIFCVSVDSLTFLGEDSGQVGNMGLKFGRQSKSDFGNDLMKTIAGDVESGRLLGERIERKRRTKSKPWETPLPVVE